MDWIIKYMKSNNPADAYNNNSNDARRMIKNALRYHAAQARDTRNLFAMTYGPDHEIIKEINEEVKFATKWFIEFSKEEAKHDRKSC